MVCASVLEDMAHTDATPFAPAFICTLCMARYIVLTLNIGISIKSAIM